MHTYRYTTLALAAGFALCAGAAAGPQQAQARESFSLHVPGFSLHVGPRYGYYDRYDYRYYPRYRHRRHGWNRHHWREWKRHERKRRERRRRHLNNGW